MLSGLCKLVMLKKILHFCAGMWLVLAPIVIGMSQNSIDGFCQTRNFRYPMLQRIVPTTIADALTTEIGGVLMILLISLIGMLILLALRGVKRKSICVAGWYCICLTIGLFIGRSFAACFV